MPRSVRKLVGSVLGTIVVLAIACAGGALLYWNLWGQGPYQDTCRSSLGCRSFSCMRHALSGSAQVEAPGHCTKSCDTDADCGSGAACVVLGDDARGDLPPLGKPDKACLQVLGSTR